MPLVTVPKPSASLSPPVSRVEGARDRGFAIYFHWPFCQAKCPYCDFNSHVRAGVSEQRWRAALLAELEHQAERTPGRPVSSIFFGGGTPSLMSPETVAALVARVRALWPAAADLEISLEANPGASDAGKFSAFADCGINRLSLGVQALDDDALTALGRIHGRSEALTAIEWARKYFPRYSFDLIYARPGQALSDWRRELDAAIALAGDHLSLYQLTIEPGTAFHTAARLGKLKLPAEAEQIAMLDLTWDRLAAAGLPAYEVSNHARPEFACRHNLTYWRYGEYLGIGPGAHGRHIEDGARLAVTRLRRPESWLVAVEQQGHGTESSETLSVRSRCEEMVLMALRLTEGLSRDAFEAEIGDPLERYLGESRLSRLIQEGYLENDTAGVRATPAGMRRLNAVLECLLS